MTVRWNKKAVQAATRGRDVEKEFLGIGWKVAETAAALAPKDTGAGASSIHPEPIRTTGMPEVHVSWEARFFYMRFHETGTEHQRATPFLRPAANRYR